MTRPTPGPTLRLAAAFALALAAAAVSAEPSIKTIELAVETSTTEARLPDHVPGSVLLPGCGKACPNSLAVTATSTFYIGRKAVTLKALREYTLGHRGTMTVFYDPKTLALTRVQADE